MSATLSCPKCHSTSSFDLVAGCAACGYAETPTLMPPNSPSGETATLDSPASNVPQGGNTRTHDSAGTLPPQSQASDIPARLGRFVIREKLGEGAFGEVYRGHDPQLDREVAIKVAKPGTLGTRQRVVRFLREAKTAANLRHPNIVPLHETGEDAGRHFIVSAFIDGHTLQTTIESARERGEHLPITEAVRFVRRLAEALAYSHSEGVVHRDVKPSNVMVDGKSEPLLMDFGLASRADAGDEKLTSAGTVMGTPSYMAPEQAAGSGVAASDQYSLGCTLYELLTGHTPFSGPPLVQMVMHQSQAVTSPRKQRPDVPRDLETIVLKCLEKEAARRYPSCGELAEDLRRFDAGEPVAARDIGPVERFVRWAKRNPVVASSVSFGVLALLIGTVVSLTQANEARWQAKRAKDAADDAFAKKLTADEKTDDANKSAKRAEEARELALSAVASAKYQLTRLHIATGTRAQEAAEPFTALHWYAKAWNDDPSPLNEAGHRSRIGSSLTGVPTLMGVCFHDAGVDDVAINPAGTRLVTRTRNQEQIRGNAAYLWDFAGSQLALPPLVHTAPVRFAGFSPNGSYVVTASEDKTAVLWDAETGKRVHTLLHDAPVMDTAFAPDGRTVATASGKQAILWLTATGKPSGVVIQLPAKVTVLEFSRDADRLLVADEGGSFQVWNPVTAEPAGPIMRWLPPDDYQDRLYKNRPVLSPDGKRILVPNHKIQAVESETGRLLWEMTKPVGGYLEWSADNRLAIVGQAMKFSICDAETGQSVASFMNPRQSAYAALAPDGQTLACGITGGGIVLWDTTNGKPRSAMLQCASYLRRVRISADGKYLVAASEDGTARVWDLSATRGITSEPYKYDCGRAHIPVFEGGVSASPDGRNLFRPGPNGGTLDRQSGPLLLPHSAPVTTSRFSANGKRLATFAGDAVRVWDVTTGTLIGPVHPLPQNAKPVRLDLSEDGGRIAATIRNHLKISVVVWDVQIEREIFILPSRIESARKVFSAGPDGLVNENVFTPDGRLIIAGVESSGELSAFDVTTGHRLYREPTFRGYLYDLTMGPAGRTVLMIGSDLAARELHLSTGKPAGPPLHHPSLPKVMLAPSPDGRRLATFTVDRMRIGISRPVTSSRAFPWEWRAGHRAGLVMMEQWFSSNTMGNISDFDCRTTLDEPMRYRWPFASLRGVTWTRPGG